MNPYFAGILSLLIAFQCLLVALYLILYKKGIRNSLLGMIFLMFAWNMGDFTIRVFGIVLSPPGIHMIDDSFFFLYGPCIYLYVQSVAYKDFAFRLRDILHLSFFLPFAGLVAYVITMSGEDQDPFMRHVLTADLPSWLFLASLGIYAHMLVYLGFSWKTVRIYRSVVKDRFSTLQGIHVEWLTFVVQAFVGIVFVAMVHNMVPIFGNPTVHYISLILLLIFSFYFIHRVLFKALNQPEIFYGISADDREKYAGSNLRSDEIQMIRARLETFMTTQKPYLNPNLVIKELADAIETTPKALSQVINQCFQKNFFDLVNSYRCREVQDLLEQDKRLTVLEAMYQSGFNSKSSFNKEFKKLTGQTPSEFKKNTKKQPSS